MRPTHPTATRPRVLVAGTGEGVATLRRLLAGEAEIVPVFSIRQALDELERDIRLVVCNVRFSESRMFDLLEHLRELPAERMPPVVCCRTGGRLPRAAHAALSLALRELGVQGFIDLVALRARHGETVADEAARRLLMAHLGRHSAR